MACQQLATESGLAPFEGYLTGLMHNIGWSAALRAIDRSAGGAPNHYSRAFIQQFESRRERLFASLVTPWQLTDGLTALAAEILEHGGLANAHSALAQALLAAEQQAALEVGVNPAEAATDAVVELSIITH